MTPKKHLSTPKKRRKTFAYYSNAQKTLVLKPKKNAYA